MLDCGAQEIDMDIYDDSMSFDKHGFSRIEVRKEGWTDGEVATPWGFVSVYAQGDDNHYYHTRLDFIHNGRLYMRNFSGKRYTPRVIKTKAMRFAKEMVLSNE
jgi:hypothetical protein